MQDPVSEAVQRAMDRFHAKVAELKTDPKIAELKRLGYRLPTLRVHREGERLCRQLHWWNTQTDRECPACAKRIEARKAERKRKRDQRRKARR